MEKYKYEKSEFNLLEENCIPLAVYQYLDNRVVTIALSAGFCELFGFEDRKEAYRLMDNDMYRDTHPDDVAYIADAAVRFATKDEPYDVVYRSKLNGRYKIIHAFGKHIQKDGVRLAMVWYVCEGEFQANSENKNNSLEKSFSDYLNATNLSHSVQYDFLTGLPTISYFFSMAEIDAQKAAENGKNAVLIFLDLNGMKYFNLKYGFGEGNNLIRAFSRLIVEHFNHSNCCRFGMDRFCVSTDDTDLEQRLWNLFSDCENINNGRTLPVRAGIYSSAMGRCGVSFACDRAKMACDSGRNIYVSHFTYFDKSMLSQSEKRQYIIDNIDRAIEEKWIKVYYQPIVRAANGCVSDEEALSRWIDPEKGFLSPADFIPILENANLIYKLDLYVAEQILEKMKVQAQAGLYVVPTSVNLSRSDFDSCNIVEEIHKRVTEAGISPEKLTIEITESVIGSDYEYMKTQVEKFQSLGFKVWMDDFGSGYSSLDVLKGIRFDLIKLDMKFMQEFEENEKSKIILSALVRLAMGLEIETVCEGVETEAQAEFLKEIGCTKLQGFYYCKPIPQEEVFRRYETGTQIGFENPAESDYYAHIGKINLYDLSVVTNSDKEIFQNYFNTLPMAILEYNGKELSIVRGNKSYREFIKKYFTEIYQKNKIVLIDELSKADTVVMKTILQCENNSKPLIIEEILSDGARLSIYIRRLAVNPVTGVKAFVTVFLGVNYAGEK
ncbi:MAG: EAL domain-containing protein [Treponema sp.]|nr:EAL domain-containing protein [Treponema sp.]